MGGFLSPSSRNRSAIFPERGMFLNHRACPFLVRFRRFDPSTHLRGPPPPCLGGRGRWGPPILSVPLFLPISTGNIPVGNPVVDPDRRDPEGEGRTGRDHQGVSRGDPFRPEKGERDRPGQPSISKAIPVGGTSPPPPHPSDSGSLFPRTTDRMVRAFGLPFWLPGGSEGGREGEGIRRARPRSAHTPHLGAKHVGARASDPASIGCERRPRNRVQRKGTPKGKEKRSERTACGRDAEEKKGHARTNRSPRRAPSHALRLETRHRLAHS